MSCCNFGNRRDYMRGRCGRFSEDFDDRRGCFPINWGPCRDNRFCPRRDQSRRGFLWPY